MDKITVILTTYNAEDVIQRTISSILAQNGLGEQFELELIVVDDCSKDNTVSILRSNGVDVLSTPANSGGPNKGRNMGLGIASGNWICIADQDDEWDPDRLSTQLRFANKAPIISSGYTLLDHATGKKTVRARDYAEEFLLFDTNATFKTQMYRSKQGQHCYLGSLMYSSTLKDVTFEEKYGMVDYDWYLRLFYGQSSLEVCKSLYTRHIDGSNLSMNENYRQRDFDYAMETLNTYQSEFPAETRLARKRMHGSRARYFYSIEKMKEAREHLKNADKDLLNLLYYLTSYIGYRWVNKRFKVFG